MSYQVPETARQEILCSLFAEVLGMPSVGVTDNFFDVGGQSVFAMVLSARISEVLSVDVSMADIFEAPTIAELDQRLDVTTEGVPADDH
jgi:nonribosomal peptide synthetase DhbF